MLVSNVAKKPVLGSGGRAVALSWRSQPMRRPIASCLQRRGHPRLTILVRHASEIREPRSAIEPLVLARRRVGDVVAPCGRRRDDATLAHHLEQRGELELVEASAGGPANVSRRRGQRARTAAGPARSALCPRPWCVRAERARRSVESSAGAPACSELAPQAWTERTRKRGARGPLEERAEQPPAELRRRRGLNSS